MKIISQEEHWMIDKATTAISGVEFRNKVFADVPFNLRYVRYKAINNELEFIMLPYVDEKLQTAVGGLAYDIATNNDWLYPDYDNVKMTILINTDGNGTENFTASLCLEVQPPKYSEEEKADILASADKNMYHTDFSEYTIWLDTFASAEAFHNGRDGGMSETMGTYDIEFEPEEQNALQWFLIQHLQMVALGGRYAS